MKWILFVLLTNGNVTTMEFDSRDACITGAVAVIDVVDDAKTGTTKAAATKCIGSDRSSAP